MEINPVIENIPIVGASGMVELDGTPKNIDELGLGLDPRAKTIRYYFRGDPDSADPIARYAHDNSFPVTDTEGIPAIPVDIHVFNITALLDRLRSVSGTLMVFVEQFGERMAKDFKQGYTMAIAQLLPDGYAWEAKCTPESNLYKLIVTIAHLINQWHLGLCKVLDQFYASTADCTAGLWRDESFTATADACLERWGLTLDEEVKAAVAKVISRGASSVADYVEIANAMGLDVDIIDDPDNFKLTFNFTNVPLVGSEVCAPLCRRIMDGGLLNLVFAYICIINAIAPAQSDLCFTIGDCILEV
jgi:uncharacterized protein YmfQ (DUF2313 family)